MALLVSQHGPQSTCCLSGHRAGPLKSPGWVTTSPSPGSPSATSEKQPPPPCLAPTVQGHHIFPASATTDMSHELKQPFNVPVVVTAHFFPLRGLTISPFMPGSSRSGLAQKRRGHLSPSPRSPGPVQVVHNTAIPHPVSPQPTSLDTK